MKPPVLPTPESRADRVREIAAILRLDAVRIIALERHFDAGNTAVAQAVFELTKEGQVVRLIRGVTMEAIALACARACEKRDSGWDRRSIPAAQELLSDSTTFTLVSAPPGSKVALEHFLRLADEVLTSYSHGRLRVFRDYKVAHHLPSLFEGEPAPQINHLWDQMEGVLQAIYFLSVGTGVNLVSLDAEAKVWTGYCEAYWKRLLGGPARARKPA